MLPSYLPSNMTSEEFIALMERELPGCYAEKITQAQADVEAAAHEFGFDAGCTEAAHSIGAQIIGAIDLLEAIPEDNGADASTDRAIAEAIKTLRAAL